MSITHRPCDLCGRPAGGDQHVCATCAADVTSALREVATWLADALVDITARRGGGAAPSGVKPTKASEAPLPITPHVSEASWVLRNTLVGWVRVLHVDTHVPLAGPACYGICAHRSCRELRRSGLPKDDPAALARWLLPLVGLAWATPWGAQMAEEIPAAVHQAKQAIERCVRYVPLPDAACRHIALDGQVPVACGQPVYAVIAPGLSVDGQIRCSTGDREHTSTVHEEAAAKKSATRVRDRVAGRLTR